MTNVSNFFAQNGEFTFLSTLLIIAFAIFLTVWLKNPASLINGMIFTAFLIILAVWITYLVLATNLHGLMTFYLIVGSLIILSIAFIAAFAWLFFLWNAYFVWKYESHTLPNLLTLFIGLILIITWVIIIIGPFRGAPVWLKLLLSALPAVVVYLLLIAYNFLISLALYQLVPRCYNQDYLIVLGAGLSNGETVTPLLANRINRAIQFAERQVAKGHQIPKFIMSGGQGADEKVAEADAMANYAIKRGISAKQILRDTKSKNTYQNMLFAKEVAVKDYGSEKFNAKFFSNNYHIFRAAIYAKKAKLHASGVGCYTRFYFLPNAIVREFVGIVVMHKKRHFIVIGLIALAFMIAALLSFCGITFF